MKWIAIEVSFPPHGEDVIVLASHNRDSFMTYGSDIPEYVIFTGYWDPKDKMWCSNIGDGFCPYEKDEVTHWMRLPTLPKDL